MDIQGGMNIVIPFIVPLLQFIRDQVFDLPGERYLPIYKTPFGKFVRLRVTTLPAGVSSR